MTAPALDNTTVVRPPRPGSRIARLAQPLARNVLRLVAEANNVCVNPIVIRRTDLDTGETGFIEVPCGARLASKCKPCAERNQRLRRQQIREGWHLADEPVPPPAPPSEEQMALVSYRAQLEFDRAAAEREADWASVAELDAAIVEADEALSACQLRGSITAKDRKTKPRRTRSTRRREDVGELPVLPIDPTTVGRVYAGRDGSTHRPSMLITITLPGYGEVHTANRRGAYRVPCACGTTHHDFDPLISTPVDPSTYDYRRTALDAIHFAKLLDRWWQNVRRAAGWNAQYAGAVELQRRLAPHAHFAMRGTLPRKLLSQIAAATYHQVWWPHHDELKYRIGKPPVWSDEHETYVDPKTSEPLTSWQAALDALDDDPDAQPAHVVRAGRIDARGIEGGTKDAEKAIRYVTKYVTKDLAETAGITGGSDAQRAHFARLHAELATLPCSPTCANWLLYGVTPKDARPGLTPGRCKGKVHQKATLGFTGRRVLISRQWSGKTLSDHRADNRDWVRAVLAGHLGEDQSKQGTEDEPPRRWVFEPARNGDPDIPSLQHRLLAAIAARTRWRAALDAARTQAPQPDPQLSATKIYPSSGEEEGTWRTTI